MGFGVETVGNFDIRSLGNGKYSVTCNNGNIGACIMDKKAVEALKEKYNASNDSFTKTTESKLTPEQQHAVNTLAIMTPGGNAWYGQGVNF